MPDMSCTGQRLLGENEVVARENQDSEQKVTTTSKDRSDEIMEDEFNINSTVGLVSALLLSCLASNLADSRDLKDLTEYCESICWLRHFELYQLVTFFSMTSNVLAIMTAIARLIAFHHILKKDATSFDARLKKDGLKFWNHTPILAMTLGVISYIASMIVQASFVMGDRAILAGVGMAVFALFGLWLPHEILIQKNRRQLPSDGD
ncbi:unnamed protein product [Symbiodinium natans]|uniref:Uncharacterized protein n=1 Tax=Symbiodinium natans TaxID=878477 RepID=A0A812MNX4_9DINO|nr:unnamed protein product [Symbiodinium natans]